ncbi:hypothetical protein QM480_01835 [Flectobacillus sp. DC10W]|uniref:Uncharacterized protein n=1 Tax=Flectobacillus longus TaxID=2984207 RepID=A0ABT6YHR4_9BACT|nr:hypothetical protein [Flectobacillus longus]MDI9863050.1 hypothetical protein [Flectobacillus longus]
MLKTKISIKEPHVRKFVISRYGDDTSVIDLTRRSFLGKLTELGCQKIGYVHSLPRTEHEEGTLVTLLLPDSLKNHFLHPAKVLLFVQALEFHFREIFLAHCEVFVELGVSDYNAVENFMDKYAIEDDGKIAERLRQMWRNHQSYQRRKLEKKLG